MKAKWQPVVLVLDGRLECQCGALAVFVTGHLIDGRSDQTQYNILNDVDIWCQDCFAKAQEGQRDANT